MSQQDTDECAVRTNKIGRKAGSELLQRIVFMVIAALLLFAAVTIGLYFLNYYWFSREKTDIGSIVQPALGIVAGIGAVAYLVIAYRKQKNAEAGIIDQRMVTAIDQLSSESPQKRMAGVYALAEISDTYKGEYRQRVVDILCGYLRTDRHGKYTQEIIDYVENRVSKSGKSDNEDASPNTESNQRKIVSPDAPVESTIFRVMRERLLKNRSDLGKEYTNIQTKETDQLWCDCSFDFHGAVFVEDIDLSKASFDNDLIFDDAYFLRDVDLSYVSAKNNATFERARFGGAQFGWARFDWASFVGARFDNASFDNASFDNASFDNARFGWARFGWARFDGVRFDGASFEKARFKKTPTGNLICGQTPELYKIIFESGEIPEAFAKYMTEDQKDYAINPARWPKEED